MDVFGGVPIDRAGYRHAEDIGAALVAERLEIERAKELGRRLTVAYTDPRTGRRHERRRRGVANSSIRRCLAVAERVLRDARRRGLVSGEVPELIAAAPRAERPRRSYLEPEQIAAVLRAAGALESERRGLDWGTVERIRTSEASARALARELGVSDTLIGSAPRRVVGHEPARATQRRAAPGRRPDAAARRAAHQRVVGLDAHHLDLAGGRLQVPLEATKTEAGDRVVPLLPMLLDALRAYRLARPAGPRAPAFTTRTGTRQRPDNIRARIVAPVLARANALLAAEGRVPIAHMTPHTLRRTFASLLAVCDVPPRRAMYLMVTPTRRSRCRSINRCSTRAPDPSRCSRASSGAPWRRRARSSTGRALGFSPGIPPENTNAPLPRPATATVALRKWPVSGTFIQAAEGTRTLDLLHGKQTL